MIACSIGGNVAVNAGGVYCLKYGLTVPNIHKVEMQTIRAEAATSGSDVLESAKPDQIVTANIGYQVDLDGADRTPVRHWVALFDAALKG